MTVTTPLSLAQSSTSRNTAHVVGRFIGLTDRPITGVVLFEPVWLAPHPSALVVLKPTVSSIANGRAEQRLLPGRYRVIYRLECAALPPHYITVTPEHTFESPLDLADLSPGLRHPLPTT